MVECRKYDIEAESKKLFGEDLKTVLQKFRRTPEYLKILKEKLQNLQKHLVEIATHTIYYYDAALLKRVNEIVGHNTTETRLRSDFPSVRFEQSKDDTTDDEMVPGSNPQLLREASSTDEDGIRQLDKFYDEQSIMSAHEKNAFVDLGFEYAGRIIHSVIKSLGAEDEVKSTKFSEHSKTTTEHVKIHEVTMTSPPEASTVALHERVGAKSKNKRGRYTAINV